MGISAGGSKGGPKSEMNVTPLVDVVLVLLVIFMVSMPVMMRSITIEIPRDLDDMEVSDVKLQLSVKGLADGTIELSDGANKPETFSRLQLAAKLRERLKDIQSEKTIFVDFDDEVPWDQVVGIMDTIKGLGKVSQVDGKSTREVIRTALKKREEKPAGAPVPGSP